MVTAATPPVAARNDATAVLERAAPAAVPRAIVVGGLFPTPEGPVRVMRSLRRSGVTGDTVGLAIPLVGDPADPTSVTAVTERPPRRFDLLGYLMVVLDPHRPAPDYATLTRGQNSALTRPILGDLATWLVGVKTFRIPAVMTGEEKDDGTSGVWVLGRSNHAAAVAGAEGADIGGAIGAMSGLGLSSDLAEAYAKHVIGGACLLTTCQTDEGRARRDLQLMRKHGATKTFERPITSPLP